MLRYKQIQWQHIPFPFTRFVFIFFLAQSTFSLLSIFFLSCYLYVHLSLFLYLLVCLHCYFGLLLSFLLSVYDQIVTFLLFCVKTKKCFQFHVKDEQTGETIKHKKGYWPALCSLFMNRFDSTASGFF